MSEEKKDGGPVFPIEGKMTLATSFHGLSKRDWFASNEKTFPSVEWLLKQPEFDLGKPSEIGEELMCRWRYKMADAMLKESEKGKE